MTGSPAGGHLDSHRLMLAALLMGLTFFLYLLLATGRITRYINPSLATFTKATAAALGVLALTQLALIPLAARSCGCEEHGHRDHHGEDHGSRLPYVLLLLPLCLGAAVPAVPFDTTMALKRGIIMEGLGTLLRGAPRDPFLVAAEALYDGRLAPGSTVSITGMVVRRRERTGESVLLCRFLVFCCAADSMPVGVALEGAAVERLENGAWAAVKGRVVPGRNGTPTIQVETTKIVPVLVDPYVYP